MQGGIDTWGFCYGNLGSSNLDSKTKIFDFSTLFLGLNTSFVIILRCVDNGTHRKGVHPAASSR